MLIIDSFAWMEYLTKGPHGPTVRRRMREAGALITPDLVLAEVGRKLTRDGNPGRIARRALEAIAITSEVAPISVEVALACGDADRDLRAAAKRTGLSSPSFADCIILAFSRVRSAGVLTGDRHFLGFPDVEWVGAP
jgi:predicted nucleic acid-binding protein